MQSPKSPEEMPHAAPERSASAEWSSGKMEVVGIGVLAAMVVYFLAISWRKWPDPIVDFGQQCYATWRLSQGAFLYHDFVWSYGPVSICFNAALFRWFGPGIMVLVTANLVVYGLILLLAYWAFRKAWGWTGAFAALAVFITVFSFSHLLAVGNYNFATPYAAESTHGILLSLVTVLVVMRWQEKRSLGMALALGLCGGFSAVMKPEFMLAMAALGMAGCALRWGQRQRVTAGEFVLLAAGAVLPTLVFTVWFWRQEPLRGAFVDASQAWWLVLVQHVQSESGQQASFTGLDRPWVNIWVQLKWTVGAILALGGIGVAGWFYNQRWPLILRLALVAGALVLVGGLRWYAGWFTVGRCLPGLVVILFLIIAVRLRKEVRVEGRGKERTVMGFLLVLLAGVMLARMPLFARVFHLGFFQAALAGMVVAAFMVAELPRWCGAGLAGRGIAVASCALTLGLFCVPFTMRSREIRADQTEPVGEGRDRFYSTTRAIDGTGALVNWASQHLRDVRPEATVLVLPDGGMINYLSRHKTMEPGWVRGGNEAQMLAEMRATTPDFVVLISRDLTEFEVKRFGTPGNFGQDIVAWVAENYVIAGKLGGDPLAVEGPPGAIVLRRKTN